MKIKNKLLCVGALTAVTLIGGGTTIFAADSVNTDTTTLVASYSPKKVDGINYFSVTKLVADQKGKVVESSAKSYKVQVNGHEFVFEKDSSEVKVDSSDETYLTVKSQTNDTLPQNGGSAKFESQEAYIPVDFFERRMKSDLIKAKADKVLADAKIAEDAKKKAEAEQAGKDAAAKEEAAKKESDANRTDSDEGTTYEGGTSSGVIQGNTSNSNGGNNSGNNSGNTTNNGGGNTSGNGGGISSGNTGGGTTTKPTEPTKPTGPTVAQAGQAMHTRVKNAVAGIPVNVYICDVSSFGRNIEIGYRVDQNDPNVDPETIYNRVVAGLSSAGLTISWEDTGFDGFSVMVSY